MKLIFLALCCFSIVLQGSEDLVAPSILCQRIHPELFSFVKTCAYFALGCMDQPLVSSSGETLYDFLDSPEAINCLDGAGFAAIHYAVLGRSLSSIKLLLRQYPHLDLYGLTEGGWTPLHCAAVSSSADESNEKTSKEKAENAVKEMTRFLLSKGIPVDILAGDGSTPLIIAAENGNYHALEVLLENGALPNTYYDARGVLPIHAAAIGGMPETLIRLLNVGVPVDMRTKNGITPLRLAIEFLSEHKGTRDHRRYRKTIRILLARGADAHVAADDGQTPLGVAKRLGCLSALRCIHERSCDV